MEYHCWRCRVNAGRCLHSIDLCCDETSTALSNESFIILTWGTTFQVDRCRQSKIKLSSYQSKWFVVIIALAGDADYLQSKFRRANFSIKLSFLCLQASWCAWTFSQMPWNASTMLRSVGNARSSSDPAPRSLCASWPSWWSTVSGLPAWKYEGQECLSHKAALECMLYWSVLGLQVWKVFRVTISTWLSDPPVIS